VSRDESKLRMEEWEARDKARLPAEFLEDEAARKRRKARKMALKGSQKAIRQRHKSLQQ